MDIVYEWIGWILIAIGAVGCFLPVLPGPPIAYAALFLALARGGGRLDHAAVLDQKKFNCSRVGMLGCFIGTIVGLFFLPLGVVLGPFLGALAGELLSGKPFGRSLKGAFGAFLGYLCGVALKVACCGFIAYQFWTAVHGS